ncbi:hypothetical protein [Lacrimispora sp. 210928-DFI.3.58]|uniref:hypothetical protein n=1 Tax=Lacrimispora sp. 210928-DFI.3.58 TaxID=2883214 RepID=UPI0022223A7D|nr:hypothetical protein [Lacrimispora sp. 210928-DFI.3.58]
MAIHEKRLDNYFIFEKFVKPEQALSLCEVTVLPSEKEGFAICAIESFLMKRLHIRTKTAGYSDMDDCCIGIDIGDDVALAKEIENYLDGKDYSELIEHAYETTKKKFTVDVMTSHILDVYEKAMAK